MWVGVELAHKLSQMNGPDLCDHSSAIRALTTRGRHPIVLGSPLAQLNVDSNWGLMLVRKGQYFNLQIVMYAQEAVDIDA